ncbi:alpha/beta hydrolase [Stakelama pacifica]|uniref:Acetyl esterase/lipase n=1 Tax=Stakelama pacifica TaxID=517720 RepID=A0A4R6FHD5_9SPHN|nr:alpha/beta hydrolase [Stakelama pacifica]TDN79875.1 acetyl esterase/lipase [Stakelama pacifica]GGO98079.1 endo-1,4-beta-xylanase [Stakelama pacifica]
MTIDRRTLIGSAIGIGMAGMTSAAASAQDWPPAVPADRSPNRPAWPPRETFRIWPGRAPGSPETLPVDGSTMEGPADGRQLWVRGVAHPTLSVYRPEKPDGRAVLCMPGGGYKFLSVQNEGIHVAAAFNPHGITVFVLTYRLPGEGWANRADVPLQDAQRAMRVIRSRAAQWNIDPAKLGCIGFSAGGHLAASLTVGFDDKVYSPVDDADTQSARPAYSGLIYPVIDLSIGPNGDSTKSLVGPDATPEQYARYEASKRVTGDTPPMFIVQALDDPIVNPQNAINMMEAARAHEVPVEAHFFEHGGHGFGIKGLSEDMPAAHWPLFFRLWSAKHS